MKRNIMLALALVTVASILAQTERRLLLVVNPFWTGSARSAGCLSVAINQDGKVTDECSGAFLAEVHPDGTVTGDPAKALRMLVEALQESQKKK